MKAFLVSVGICLLFVACKRSPAEVQVPLIPEGTTASNHDSGRGLRIVTVNRQGRISIGDQQYFSQEDLRPLFARDHAQNPKVAIAINADRRAPYETVTSIMLLARAAGVARISLFVGTPGESEAGLPVVSEESLNLLLE